MKRLYFTILVAMVTVFAHAAAPNGSGNYYSAANGKKGSALKTSMCGIIYNRTEKSYDYLWTAFKSTDVKSNGKIWDMYSNITNYTPVTKGSSYSVEGDCYNREHSFPQSWFGSNAPMYTDLHHIYPTDGKVNGMRANYPFGTTTGNRYKSANDFSKLGNCNYSGYTGVVFEPADEYKGDFARTYFYMITCYEEKLHDWYTNYSSTDVVHVIDGSTYPGFQTWQLNMLLAWAASDPVSDKEIARNTAVKNIQGNRNPFIDYPGLEQYIWGSKKDETFSYDNYVQPTTWSTEYNNSGSGQGGQGGGDATGNYYARITSTDNLTSGQYLIVYEDGNLVFDGSLTTLDAASNNISVTISDHKITASSTVNAAAFTIATVSGGYSIKSASGYYIGQTSNSNGLASNQTTAYTNTISFEGNNANIVSSSAYLRYNTGTSDNRFRYYKSSSYTFQQPIQLYKFVESAKPAPSFNDLEELFVTYDTSKTLTKGSEGTEYIVTDGNVTLSSSNTAVATVSGLTITSKAVGECVITVNCEEGSNYAATTHQFNLTVTAPEGKTAAAPNGSATTVFKETFAKCLGTGGNDGSWSGSIASSAIADATNTINNGWTFTKGYVGNDCARLSSSTDMGSATTPALGTSGTLTLTFKAGAWNGDKTTGGLTLSIEAGEGTLGQTTFNLKDSEWSSYGTTITGATAATKIKFSAAQASKNRFFLDEVEVTKPGEAATFSVKLNSSGYATYCSEYPLDFSNATDFTAWQVTGISGTAITFSQVTGAVKGGTGLLLMGEPNATVTLSSVGSSVVLSSNLLEGTLAPTYVENDAYYGLSGSSFVKVNAGTVPAGKALLPASVVDGNSEVKALTFVFEGSPTSVSSLEKEGSVKEERIFNLAGQRLSRPQRGVNIINGKKVIVK